MSKPEFSILVLGGDGIGPEVTKEATAFVNLLSSLPNARATFKLVPRLFGGCSIDEHGTSVTEETLEQGRQCDAILSTYPKHSCCGDEPGSTEKILHFKSTNFLFEDISTDSLNNSGRRRRPEMG